jgi:hypothetical protein
MLYSWIAATVFFSVAYLFTLHCQQNTTRDDEDEDEDDDDDEEGGQDLKTAIPTTRSGSSSLRMRSQSIFHRFNDEEDEEDEPLSF